ncbi:MAG: tRNA (adenosine(37)-N6)-threonylcarbamoyltransferase complex dimerization subunit type 1 TsaB [Candidatus Nanopelagicales bacterium]
MLILGVDTATEQVGAAILDTDRAAVLGWAVTTGPAVHGEQLAPIVVRALAEAGVAPSDLGAVGVGRGPGPFTGLRVGLVHARVLGWALGIPVHGVCTLDVLAAEAVAGGLSERFLVATDARRREVYWALYDESGGRVAGPEVGAATAIPCRDLPAVGAGAARYPEAFADRRGPLHPDPGVLAQLVARMVASNAAADASPLYLRRPDAVANASRKRVTPP